MRTVLALLRLIRPKQWTKNLVVFAGLLFSGNVQNAAMQIIVWQAFVVFCLAAGVIYIFNDLRDLESDRLHPSKKTRPLASGQVSQGVALGVGVLLLGVSLLWAWLLSSTFFVIVLVYILLNIAYSLGLKQIVIVDVFIITLGFVLRAAAGAWVIQVPISPWLLIVTTLLSLFLGFAKRRHELVTMGTNAGRHRKSLDDYSPELLDQYMSIVASSTIIAYCLYAFTSGTAQKHQYLMLTVPFTIYGILRYLYLVYQKQLGGAPELILLRDKPIMIAILLWTAAVLFILHLG